MKIVYAFSFLILAGVASSQTTSCKPGDNCRLPDCRCWNDPSIPGNIPEKDTPQMILLTFEYAVNSANVDNYKALFQGLVNPNNCPGVGAFYVQMNNTDLAIVKSLSDTGHEIGVTSVDGTLPQSEQAWRDGFALLRDELVAAGVPSDKIQGVQAPELKPGGLEQFMAMAQENFNYDASCTTQAFLEGPGMWPYTYDYAPGPACDDGEGPEQAFPGKWQVLLGDLRFNGTKCATPAACTSVKTKQDAFDMFYNSFIRHYENGRTPFMIYINADWLTTDFKLQGTLEFLEYVRAAFDDTWILSVGQALEWVKDPVPNANATSSYPPWGCA